MFNVYMYENMHGSLMFAQLSLKKIPGLANYIVRLQIRLLN